MYIYIYIQPRKGKANSGRMLPNTANTGANTENKKRSTRKPTQHGTTSQVATRHATGQHDTDRHGPPLVYVVCMFVCSPLT